MNEKINVQTRCLMPTVVLLLAGIIAQGQTPTPSPQSPAGLTQTQNQAPNNQAIPNPDLRQLNLTPDQIQKLRAIYDDTKAQRQATNLRLRQAQRALAEAIEAPTPDESLIEQRSRDLADARAEAARLRSLTEARILHEVLTPEQRQRLKEMRQQAQAQQRARNQQNQRNSLGKYGLPRNPNGPPPGQKQRKILQPQTTKPKR